MGEYIFPVKTECFFKKYNHIFETKQKCVHTYTLILSKTYVEITRQDKFATKFIAYKNQNNNERVE